jgi:sec-independent protein translocase protein TatC
MALMTNSVAGTAGTLAPRGAWSGASAWRRTALELAAAISIVSREMPFLDHLEELRRRLIWSIASVVLAFAACWVFVEDLYRLARAPIQASVAVELAILRPQDIFTLYFKVAFVAALFLAAPMILTQAWLFIAPGLHRHERRWAIPFVASATLLFAAGGAFGYFIAFPAALRFLLEWIVAGGFRPMIDASEYFNLFFTIIVSLGVIFQIPAVIFVLSRIGLVTAGLLLRNFKYAVLGSVIIAAVITPTTDWPNLLIIAGPMVVLYAVGIGVAWIFGRRREPDESAS